MQSWSDGMLRMVCMSVGKRTPWTRPRATSPSSAVSASVMRCPLVLENRKSQLLDPPVGMSLRGSTPDLFFFGSSGRRGAWVSRARLILARVTLSEASAASVFFPPGISNLRRFGGNGLDP